VFEFQQENFELLSTSKRWNQVPAKDGNSHKEDSELLGRGVSKEKFQVSFDEDLDQVEWNQNLGRLLSSVDSRPSCGTNPQPSMCV
jgi:hypothetical protein